jgi:hypothetical protein
MIKVSAAEFARTNKGLISVLRALQRMGGEASTRRLLKEIKTTGYGQVLIGRAEVMGYITREDREPEGKGNWLVVNKLTQKGKRLLDNI